MYITTHPGAHLFDSFVWHINVTYRAWNDMSGHVKVLAYILLLKIIWDLYCLGTLQKVFLWWTRIDENKHKRFKSMPMHCWLDDPETE